MNDSIIEIKNVGKKYLLRHEKATLLQYVTLRDVLGNTGKKIVSILKKGRLPKKEVREQFWALQNVSFSVQKGEILGIVGHNGAGKSTLLKILSQITPPTTGEIRIHGTVGSLLEIGAGFHPELSGRENIFLNGAVLGMKKKDIIRNFEKIVQFAGVEKFLDTPVKHYSSGMYVRLAFSVAAHMEPDVLIIDEVLAVGDAEFQKQCIAKMKEIAKTEGRTILFISHNMQAIKDLCKRSVFLDKGQVVMIGETHEVIEKYLEK